MKKFLDLSNDIFPCKIIFCPTREAHKKYLDKNHDWMSEQEKTFNTHAVTTVINEDDFMTLVVGIDKIEDIYEAKGLIVHELNHVVSNVLVKMNVMCDETRAYFLQSLYIKTMKFYDNFLEKENAR